MSIKIGCPKCGEKTEVPDSAAGSRGKCCACGSVVQVPPKAPKLCSVCGIDVSRQPRTKDAHGHYFCNPCWAEHQDFASERSIDPPASDELLSCPQCGGVFGVQEMDVSGVCMTCATRSAPTKATVRKSSWSSETRIITAIVLPVVVIGAAVIVWVLWSSHTERQVRDEIARLKNIGDQRLVAGDAESASKQYADLLEYIAENKIKEDASRIVADVRRQKEQADAIVTQQAAVRRQEQERREVAARAEQQREQVNAAGRLLAAMESFRVSNGKFIEAWSSAAGDMAMAGLGAEYTIKAMQSRSKMYEAFQQLSKVAEQMHATTAVEDERVLGVGESVKQVRLCAGKLFLIRDRFAKAYSELLRVEREALLGTSIRAEQSEAVKQYDVLLEVIWTSASEASGTIKKIEALAASVPSIEETVDATASEGGEKGKSAVVSDATARAVAVAPSMPAMAVPAAKSTDPRYLKREFTDPLIVIEHSGSVAERQYSGFFASNDPKDIYMRGKLRSARTYFGKNDVFCVHPWSQEQPASADFSAITSKTSGVLVIELHNLFDPESKQAGDCQATFKVDGKEFRKMTVGGNVWQRVDVPFDRNRVEVEIAATGWFWEHAFFTYAVRAAGQDGAVAVNDTSTDAAKAPRKLGGVSFVVDSDGSMLGNMPVVIGGINKGVSELTPDDHFNVIFARQTPLAFSQASLVPAKPENVAKLADFLQGASTPGGRADVLAALQFAITQKPEVIRCLISAMREEEHGAALDALKSSAAREGVEIRIFVATNADGEITFIERASLSEVPGTAIVNDADPSSCKDGADAYARGIALLTDREAKKDSALAVKWLQRAFDLGVILKPSADSDASLKDGLDRIPDEPVFREVIQRGLSSLAEKWIEGRGKPPSIMESKSIPPSVDKVVFVIDNGGSMLGLTGSLYHEVMTVIGLLKPVQSFNVVIAQEQKEPLVFLQNALVPATKENITQVGRSFNSVNLVRRADCARALRRAIDLKPNVIRCFISETREQEQGEALANLASAAARDNVVVQVFIVSEGSDGDIKFHERASSLKLPTNAGSSVAQAKATDTKYHDGITQEDVDRWRKGKLDYFDQAISDGVVNVQELPAKSPQRKALADTIRSYRTERDTIGRMTDAAIAERIGADNAAQVQRARTAKQDAEERRRAAEQAAANHAAEVAAARRQKFPNWDGPWAICPLCRGTGRDADAERDANMRTASIVGGQFAGTGGSTKRSGAVVTCDVCGGSGDVPESR